jgi:lipid II:glycine glycyltransferase (peptidoglycan interpeptide bridge formation enzyme)
MEFQELYDKDMNKSKWDAFIMQNSPESFLQSGEWGEFQAQTGRQVRHYAVKEGTKLLAVVQAIEHCLPLGFKYWYLPRGPVLGVEDSPEILTYLLAQMKLAARAEGAVFVRLDPALSKDKADLLIRSGCRHLTGSVQPKDTLVLELTKSEEELLAEMKQKTRYNLRLAEKKGVAVTAIAYTEENFEKFWQLTTVTTARDGIVSHEKEYYHQLLATLSSGRGLQCLLYSAAFEGETIAANLVLFFGPYSVYLHGASSDAQRNLMAPYLLQWRQLQDAKARGCTTYDFWGITLGAENPRWAGITRFKTGFGGREVSYAGAFDLPVNTALYGLYRLFKKN